MIPQLIQFAQNQENTALRVHTLQTIGYICEVIVSHMEKEVGLG